MLEMKYVALAVISVIFCDVSAALKSIVKLQLKWVNSLCSGTCRMIALVNRQQVSNTGDYDCSRFQFASKFPQNGVLASSFKF